MTAAIIAVDIAIAALCVAGFAFAAYLLRRDRHLIWHSGDPLPDIPADSPLGQLSARLRAKRYQPADRCLTHGGVIPPSGSAARAQPARLS